MAEKDLPPPPLAEPDMEEITVIDALLEIQVIISGVTRRLSLLHVRGWVAFFSSES